MLVVPCTRTQRFFFAESLPCFTTIIGTEHCSIFCFNNSPDTSFFGGRNGDSDFPQQSLRQALFTCDFAPGVAAIDRFEYAAAFATTDECMRQAPGLPETGVQDARVVWVKRKVTDSGIITAEEKLLPGLPAIFGTIHGPLCIRSMSMTQGCNIDQIWILWVNAHFGNVARILQAKMSPGFPSVS